MMQEKIHRIASDLRRRQVELGKAQQRAINDATDEEMILAYACCSDCGYTIPNPEVWAIVNESDSAGEVVDALTSRLRDHDHDHEIENKQVNMWLFPRDDYLDWIELIAEEDPASPIMKSYDDYLAFIEQAAVSAISSGATPAVVCMGVDEMRSMLTETGLANTSKNRAIIIGQMEGEPL